MLTLQTHREKAEVMDFERRISAHGYDIRYVEWCEDARTPGFLGQIRGATDRERREVRISTRANPTHQMMIEILAQELRQLNAGGSA